MWKKNVLVVRWNDWLDEITLSDNTQVFELNAWNITNYEISPEQFWFERVNLDEILILENQEKVDMSKSILSWEEKSAYNDLVDLNVRVVKDILLKSK